MQATTHRGTRIVKHHHKNPIRVAAGKRTSHMQKGNPDLHVRSAHLGYDCYVTGTINSGGRTRIVMRRARMPDHLSQDIIAMMPVEMWWPQRDHRAAHALIDAILTCDLNTLASWKSSWPDHTFGYEQFMEVCERRLTGIKNAAEPENPNKRTDGTGQRDTITLMFPGIPESVERHGAVDAERFCIRTWIVRFNDGQVALRVDVSGVVAGPHRVERVPCSRAYVDLVSGKFEIIEHYPGRLKGLGLPVGLIYGVLGVRPPPANRRQHQKRPLYPLHREYRPETSREHSLAITERARKVQTVLSTGEIDAEVIKERVQRPDPMPIPGNRPYERQRAQEIEDPDVEQFPDAPGSRPSR